MQFCKFSGFLLICLNPMNETDLSIFRLNALHVAATHGKVEAATVILDFIKGKD